MTTTPHPALDLAARTSTGLFEAAVVLESSGINDRIARQVYGAEDVFALAGTALRERTAAPIEPGSAATEETIPATHHIGSRWFLLRGLLYAVPAVVALCLLPASDPAVSALQLIGLVLSWAGGYGVSYVAWAYLGNADMAGARRFLGVSLLVGTAAAALPAVLGVYAALLWTDTMNVSLWTVPLLVGQTAYLLAAITLLMTGRELWLLCALLPALVGTALELSTRLPAGMPGSGLGAGHSGLEWLGVTVVAATVLALVSAWGGARRPVPGVDTWRHACLHTGYGLNAALLVLFPAANELINENFEALPLSVTLAALPLVVGMGIAEGLLHRYRKEVRAVLAAISSRRVFARRIRVRVVVTQLRFAVALGAITAALVGGVTYAGMSDNRFLIIGVDYLVLGIALFAAMLLKMMGRVGVVTSTLGAAVVLLGGLCLGADYLVSDAAALLWFGGVCAVLALTHIALVHVHVARTESHW